MRTRRRSRPRCRRRRRGRRAAATSPVPQRDAADVSAAVGEAEPALALGERVRRAEDRAAGAPRARPARVRAPRGGTSPRSSARSGSPGTCASTSTVGQRDRPPPRARRPPPRAGGDRAPSRSARVARAAVVDDGRSRASEREPCGRSTRRNAAPATRPVSRSARRPAGSGGRRRHGSARRARSPGRSQTAQRSGKSSSSTCHCRAATCLRLCEKMRSASWSVSAEPMSYHSPGQRQV